VARTVGGGRAIWKNIEGMGAPVGSLQWMDIHCRKSTVGARAYALVDAGALWDLNQRVRAYASAGACALRDFDQWMRDLDQRVRACASAGACALRDFDQWMCACALGGARPLWKFHSGCTSTVARGGGYRVGQFSRFGGLSGKWSDLCMSWRWNSR
jgi:hypothetical protein